MSIDVKSQDGKHFNRLVKVQNKHSHAFLPVAVFT